MPQVQYTVVLHPDPETGGYGVEVPALPGVVTQGATYEEALAVAADAVRVHLAGLRQDGEPIPPDVQPRLATVQVAA